MWVDIEKNKDIDMWLLKVGEVNGSMHFAFNLTNEDMEFLASLLKSAGFC